MWIRQFDALYLLQQFIAIALPEITPCCTG
jgi:hypothetical protein